MLANKKEANV